jgi:hypothetical protein
METPRQMRDGLLRRGDDGPGRAAALRRRGGAVVHRQRAAAHRRRLGGLSGAHLVVSRPFPSWDRSILTAIYLCHACSHHKIEDGNARTGAAPCGRRRRRAYLRRAPPSTWASYRGTKVSALGVMAGPPPSACSTVATTRPIAVLLALPGIDRDWLVMSSEAAARVVSYAGATRAVAAGVSRRCGVIDAGSPMGPSRAGTLSDDASSRTWS